MNLSCCVIIYINCPKKNCFGKTGIRLILVTRVMNNNYNRHENELMMAQKNKYIREQEKQMIFAANLLVYFEHLKLCLKRNA